MLRVSENDLTFAKNNMLDSMSPQVSFIIPSLGSAVRLNECVFSILNQQLKSYEIIVIVGKNAGNVDFIFPKGVRVHYFPSAAGSPALRNLGAHVARGEILYFLDDDCILNSETFLNKFLSALPETENIWCGGYISHAKSSWAGEIYNCICQFWLKSRLNISVSSVFLGGNFAIRKATWSKNRIQFAENLQSGGEELLLAHRLRSLNLSIVYKKHLDVKHLSRHSTLSCLGRAWTHGLAPSRDYQGPFSIRKGFRFLPWDPMKLFVVFIYFSLTNLGRFWFLANRKSTVGQAENCPTAYAK